MTKPFKYFCLFIFPFYKSIYFEYSAHPNFHRAARIRAPRRRPQPGDRRHGASYCAIAVQEAAGRVGFVPPRFAFLAPFFFFHIILITSAPALN